MANGGTLAIPVLYGIGSPLRFGAGSAAGLSDGSLGGRGQARPSGKSLFGTTAWTPLLMSTTWETSKSMAMLARE